MPRYKSVKPLYTIALKETYRIIKLFCANLQESDLINHSTILASVNSYLCINIPTW